MRKVKYVLGVFLILGGLEGIKDSIITGLIILIIGLLVLPPVSDKLKGELKFWQNKVVRYGTYIGLFVLASVFLPNIEAEETLQSQKEAKQVDVKEEGRNDTDKVIYNADGKEIGRVKRDFPNIESIKWRKKPPTKREIKGNWFHVVWFSLENPNDKIFYRMGDSEQKKLTLTKNTYQTSSIGLGENPLFGYELRNGRLIVKTRTQLASEIYNNKIKLSKDKKYLSLERDYNVYIYMRK